MTGNTMKDVKNLKKRADAVGKEMTSGCFEFFKMMFGFFLLGIVLFILYLVFGML